MGFLDIFRSRSRRVAPTQTIGASGTSVVGGYINEGEKSSDLTGRQRYITYSTMLSNTTIVSAGVRLFLNMIGKPSWRAEPADDSAEARALAEFVEETMADMATPWHRIVRRAAMFKFYGFSVSEWTAKRRSDGRIGYLDIEPRPQSSIERWDTDEQGHVLGIVQRPPQTWTELYLPRSKVIYVVDDALSDSPEGLGLFRHLVSASLRRTRYEQLEGVGYETDLRGVPVGRAPLAEMQAEISAGRLTPAGKAALEKPINDFVENHIKGPTLGIVIDSATYKSEDESGSPSNVRQFDVELLKGALGSAHGDIDNALSRIDHEMARVLGVEHMLLGQNRGTQALSKDKSSNFGLIIESALKEVRETFEADYLGPLWALNGFNPDLMPELQTDSIQYRDIAEVVGVLEGLARSGAPILPDDEAVNVVRSQAGLPNADLDAMAADSQLAPTITEPPNPDEPSDELEDDDEE